MKYIQSYIILCFFSLTIGCNNYSREKMKVSEFDASVLQNLSKYETLCLFLEKHKETIYNYKRDQKIISGNCQLYVESFTKKMISPDIKEEYYEIIDFIGKGKSISFRLCPDGSIDLTVRSDYVGFFDNWKWTQYHRLEYKPKKDSGRFYYEIIADTLLSENFRYYIYLHNT